MAFGNVDFTKTNAALQRLSQIMGYNWMDKERTRRDMESFMEQLGQREEYAKRGEQREMGMYKEKSAINLQDDFNKMLLDVQKDPNIDAKFKETRLNYQRYLQTHDPIYLEQAKASAGQGFKLGSPLIDASLNALEGKAGPDQISAFLDSLGGEGLVKAIDQISTMKRAGMSAKLEEDRLKLEWKKHGLEREKFEAEQGVGGKGGKEYFTKWSKIINDVISFLEPIATGANVNTRLNQEASGKMNTALGHMLTKIAYGERLTPQDVTVINEARDLQKVSEKYLSKYEKPEEVIGGEVGQTLGKPAGVKTQGKIPPSPVIDKTALFNQVVGILMGKGMTREQATALAMTAPEFK